LAARSGCQGRQTDGEIIAKWRDGFQRHVSGALDRPFVVLLHHERGRYHDASATTPPPTPAERRIHKDLLAALEPSALSLADEFTRPSLVQEALFLPAE